MAAEHGYYYRRGGADEWDVTVPVEDFSWKQLAMETVKHYTESTDGSSIEVKDSAIVWHYRDADPDFGNWQVGSLVWQQTHLSNPQDVVPALICELLVVFLNILVFYFFCFLLFNFNC